MLFTLLWFRKHFYRTIFSFGTVPLQKKEPKFHFGSSKRLAATYSRASYTGTTIGKTVFDGRVRDGIGSGHSFMATKKSAGWLRVAGGWLFQPATRPVKC